MIYLNQGVYHDNDTGTIYDDIHKECEVKVFDYDYAPRCQVKNCQHEDCVVVKPTRLRRDYGICRV